MQVLALTAMSAQPTKRLHANKQFSGITIAFLLVGAVGLAMLAWPQPVDEHSQRVQTGREASVDIPPLPVPLNEPQVPLAEIDLPPPPIMRVETIAQTPAPTSTNQLSENPTPEPRFRSLPLQPNLMTTGTPRERFSSLKPQPAPPKLSPKPSAPPVAAPSASPPRAEEPVSVKRSNSATSVAQSPPHAKLIAPSDPVDEAVVTNVAATILEGRALLRILEHGKGPSIEIAWPRSNAHRLRLFSLLTRCYGLRSGVVAGNETAYVLDPSNGRISPLDLDRTSGFVRVVSGALVPSEAAAFRRLQRSLAKSSAATPVRTFPRRFDALLLGGLQLIAGKAYANGGTIRATYKIDGSRLLVSAIAVDGRRRAGAIDLTPSGRCVG